MQGGVRACRRYLATGTETGPYSLSEDSLEGMRTCCRSVMTAGALSAAPRTHGEGGTPGVLIGLVPSPPQLFPPPI